MLIPPVWSIVLKDFCWSNWNVISDKNKKTVPPVLLIVNCLILTIYCGLPSHLPTESSSFWNNKKNAPNKSWTFSACSKKISPVLPGWVGTFLAVQTSRGPSNSAFRPSVVFRKTKEYWRRTGTEGSERAFRGSSALHNCLWCWFLRYKYHMTEKPQRIVKVWLVEGWW